MGRRRPSVFLVYSSERGRSKYVFFFGGVHRSGAASNGTATVRPPRRRRADAVVAGTSLRRWCRGDHKYAIAARQHDASALRATLKRSAAPHKYKAADSPDTRPRTRDASPQTRGRAASPRLAHDIGLSRNRASSYNNPGEPWTRPHPRRRRGPRLVALQLPTRPSRSGLG